MIVKARRRQSTKAKAHGAGGGENKQRERENSGAMKDMQASEEISLAGGTSMLAGRQASKQARKTCK